MIVPRCCLQPFKDVYDFGIAHIGKQPFIHLGVFNFALHGSPAGFGKARRRRHVTCPWIVRRRETERLV